jgi:pimeloyl-ACP methyl ester carboxylesterase
MSRALPLALALVALLLTAAAPASAKTHWLCNPDKRTPYCNPPLTTTFMSPTGDVLGTKTVKADKSPKIDCFYVYPTVSDQKAPQANFAIDPEEKSIVLYQASRYTQHCRLFAPVYRQLTLQGIGVSGMSTATPAMRQTAYNDVRDAWRDYLRNDNHGRGVVLIGHSQGTFVLRSLVAKEIDPKPKVRKLLVSAILLGGNVLVGQGQDVGGDFKHVPACRSAKQFGCVIAWSTFDAPVPPNALFGHASQPGTQVLCTNPAALGGGTAPVNSVFPGAPFAPGTTIGAATTLVGLPQPQVSTTYIGATGAYDATCSDADNASVLQVSPLNGAPELHAVPDATWGLHLTDANIAQGTLVDLVAKQARAYEAKHSAK